MGLGPVVSSKKALRHAGIGAEQIDRVEFNEAFAAQVLPSVRGARHPDGEGQRQRRLARDRPPARRHRRAPGD